MAIRSDDTGMALAAAIKDNTSWMGPGAGPLAKKLPNPRAFNIIIIVIIVHTWSYATTRSSSTPRSRLPILIA